MKSTRQAEILRLINENDVETQEELAAMLKDLGFAVTQATVSRDIRELMLTKTLSGKGRMRYIEIRRAAERSPDKYLRTLKDAVVSVEPAGNLVVVKTEDGMAMASAASIDEMHFPEIVGSIAGDNAIFLAARSEKEAAKVKDMIRELIK